MSLWIWVVIILAAWTAAGFLVALFIGPILKRSRERAEATGRQQMEETKPQSILGGPSRGEAGNGH